MNWTLLGLIVLAIFVIVAPFAALRSVSWLQARRDAARATPIQDQEDDPDKPTGFW